MVIYPSLAAQNLRGYEMATIDDLAAYIIKAYPHKSELSNARLTKLIYLVDWKSVLDRGHQSSDIGWYFDNYGPFVWDVKKALEANSALFEVEETRNMYGSKKIVFGLKDDNYNPKLSPSEVNAIDFIIESTSTMNWNEFIGLVYSTYPITSSDKYSPLDLVSKAKEYRAD